ncbi:complex I intermediate-associated protein 30, mitochondrial isoform X2 [Prorops nasuta]
MTFFEELAQGYTNFKEETSLWFNEVREFFNLTHNIYHRPDHGDIKILWRFNGNKNDLINWIVTTDAMYDHGRSIASMKMTSEGKGLFYGNVNTKPVKDGINNSAGYCNVKRVLPHRSFYRKPKLNWANYNCLIMRVRGDGRLYQINIKPKNSIDIFQKDIYFYGLYTTGGPYWQYYKVPFSKFIFAAKGCIQDCQEKLQLDEIGGFSITINDNSNGPFKLEIDYIGLFLDMSIREDNAYETYVVGMV